jgi:hypothetical protein
MNPFPPGMINNYYNHSSMDLHFLPFVSILNLRAYELATMSEEERRKRERGNKMNQGKKMNKREG